MYFRCKETLLLQQNCHSIQLSSIQLHKYSFVTKQYTRVYYTLGLVSSKLAVVVLIGF